MSGADGRGGAGRHLLVQDGTFAVLDGAGDLTGRSGAATDGLFRRDARHLSRWQLTLDGAPPSVLVPGSDGARTTSALTPYGRRGEPPEYTVFREQSLADGVFTARLRLVANTARARTVRLALTVDADFADQFELRGDTDFDKPGAERSAHVLPDGVEFHYRRGGWHSRTTVTARPAPEQVTEPAGGGGRQLEWTLALPPHGTAEMTVRIAARPHGTPAPDGPPEEAPYPPEVPHPQQDRRPPSALPPSGWPALDRACAQGLADLAALRVPATGPDGAPVRPPAAGIPWFLTLFGRDALFTSLFALPYAPELADATLDALAATQATATDPDRVAEPGKIVHEIRHGELAHFGQVPYGRYYGSVDSTPLFLVLLGERSARPGGAAVARRLERQARAAVDWLFRYGGLGTPAGAGGNGGYLVYQPHQGGLANQNWKDSPGAICFADGTQAGGPVAVCEAQGYAYDALRHTARLARTLWGDPAYADRLESAADALRDRFRRDFWMPEHGFPALALDGTGRRADALASDAGHLLWSGILDQEQALATGRRLLAEDFFSGWGIRTLASGQPPYHPLSYHRGSVWPHDNAVAVLGLARYGLLAEARTVAAGLVDTAGRHGDRLPEVLAGYGRADHPEPVPYPHACSPQAWSAATPLALRTALAAGADTDAGMDAGTESAPDVGGPAGT